MVERVANAVECVMIAGEGGLRLKRGFSVAVARAAIEAMRLDVSNDMLGAGYEAMFEDKWDGTQAPMMGAGWDAMLSAALK